jgi:ABC-type branched-subunit amino acid transport system substrate-binding protein
MASTLASSLHSQAVRLQRCRALMVVASCLSLAIAVSACSGSGATKSRASGGAGSSAAGAPLKMMIEGSFSGPILAFPESETGAKAAIARINAAGGVNGRQIVTVTCDDQGNPNQAAVCGRQAVADKVVAVVGGPSLNDNSFMPALEKAHIPYIASTDILPIDHTSPISFPIESAVVDYSGQGKLLADATGTSCQNAALIAINQPGTDLAEKTITAGYKKAGGTTIDTYLFPPTTTDFTSFAATALSHGAKCIAFISAGAQQTAQFMTVIKKAGKGTPLTINASIVDDTALTPINFPAGQLTVNGSYYLPGPGTKIPALDQVVADVKGMGASGQAAIVDAKTINSYQGVLMFAQAAKGLTDVTGASVLSSLNKLESINTGLTPAFNLASPGLFDGYPQVKANGQVYYTWSGTGLQVKGSFTVTP